MNTTCLLVSSPFLFVVLCWIALSCAINLALIVVIVCLVQQRQRKNSWSRFLLVRWQYRLWALREHILYWLSFPRWLTTSCCDHAMQAVQQQQEGLPDFFVSGRARIAADMEQLLEKDIRHACQGALSPVSRPLLAVGGMA